MCHVNKINYDHSTKVFQIKLVVKYTEHDDVALLKLLMNYRGFSHGYLQRISLFHFGYERYF